MFKYQKVVLGVFKDHKDALVFEDDFDEVNDVFMVHFTTQLYNFSPCLTNREYRFLTAISRHALCEMPV